MDEQIHFLVEIQRLDSKIDQLRGEKEEIPRRLRAFRGRVEEKKKELDKLHRELKELHTLRKERELDLEEKGASVKKYQSQLYEVKTNEAYKSLLLEIENLKVESGKLEDEILDLMEQAEEINKLLKREEKNLEDVHRELELEENKLRQEEKKLKGEIEENIRRREKTVEKIDPSLLARYERIRKGKGGLAIVSVKAGICQGCHLQLPPQIVDEVRIGNRLVTCERCSRILYWNEK